MILLSASMKQVVSAKFEQVNAAKKVLWIFSGARPTVSQLQAILQTDGSINSNDLKALGTLRASVAFPASLIPRRVTAELIRWELSTRNDTVTVHSPGPAEWFAFMYAQATINEPSYSSSVKVYQSYIGEIGDIGDAGVDMELLSGTIETDKVYKTTDFEIKTLN